ncbi:MAG: hypothetical protein H6Q02_382 [Acidobacteria bacterium]|nr:hypothetical protein [Acidobacteriota bacterium]
MRGTAPGATMESMKLLLRHLAGWGFLAVGLAGLVLPVLQGWLFIAFGSLLLARDVPLFARFVCWTERRFPRLRGAIQAWRNRLGAEHGPPTC